MSGRRETRLVNVNNAQLSRDAAYTTEDTSKVHLSDVEVRSILRYDNWYPSKEAPRVRLFFRVLAIRGRECRVPNSGLWGL